jgi:hypothetical protein
MVTSSEDAMLLLRDWCERKIFLWILLEEADRRVVLRADVFIGELSPDKVTFSLESSADLTVRLLGATFTALDSSEAPEDAQKQMTGPILQVRWTGFRLSLGSTRKQPTIHWPDKT